MFQWKYFVKFLQHSGAILQSMVAITPCALQLQGIHRAPIMNQLRDDYGLHPPVCFSLSLFFNLISLLPPTQFPSSTSATPTTTWTRATATWRCRCGGRAPISPRRERSQCAPGRQIRFQLRVRMCLLQFELIGSTGGRGGVGISSPENNGQQVIVTFLLFL